MKAIMMSIKPEWVSKILNGEKTIEVRKRFPSDYVGWVYIYCTKDNKNTLGRMFDDRVGKFVYFTDIEHNVKTYTDNHQVYNGKVVARFWCDKVEEISYNYRGDFTSVYTDTLDTKDLEEQACLTRHEFAKYLKGDYGYAIHITKLEIFDKPKDISEFGRVVIEPRFFDGGEYYEEDKRFLTRAPQSWGYIEI